MSTHTKAQQMVLKRINKLDLKTTFTIDKIGCDFYTMVSLIRLGYVYQVNRNEMKNYPRRYTTKHALFKRIDKNIGE